MLASDIPPYIAQNNSRLQSLQEEELSHIKIVLVLLYFFLFIFPE